MHKAKDANFFSNARSCYNLAFELNLRALIATSTIEETQECSRLKGYLEALQTSKIQGKVVVLDEKYALDLLHFKIKELTALLGGENREHTDALISKLKEAYMMLLLMTKQFKQALKVALQVG